MYVINKIIKTHANACTMYMLYANYNSSANQIQYVNNVNLIMQSDGN